MIAAGFQMLNSTFKNQGISSFQPWCNWEYFDPFGRNSLVFYLKLGEGKEDLLEGADGFCI